MVNDPMSPLAEAATSIHELYLSYVKAGFTEDQAMKLIVALTTESVKDSLKQKRNEGNEV